MSLRDYLMQPDQSWVREALLNHRLSYELKLAAAQQGYHLLITRPDVDLGGFDLVLDDGVTNRKIQVKTVFWGSTTHLWRLRKLLLRPTPDNLRHLGYASPPPWIGLEGGFVLVTVGVNNSGKELEVEYSYCDFFTVAMMSIGIHAKSSSTAESTLQQLYLLGFGTIPIARSLLVPAKNPMHLLALMGLTSTKIYNWHGDAIKCVRISNKVERDQKVIRLEDSMRSKIRDALCGDL